MLTRSARAAGPACIPTVSTSAEFPFRRLAALLEGIAPPARAPADLGLGEPQHQPPALLAETVAAQRASVEPLPAGDGTPEHRAAWPAGWTGATACPPVP